MYLKVLFISILFLFTLSCDDDPSVQGGEGQECYPNNTCNDGLTCVGGHCVDLHSDCGDGICQEWESYESCPEDCSLPTCGNGTCDPDENETVCPEDCISQDTCGDGVVGPSEACEVEIFGDTTCESLGFAGGNISCSTDCLDFDTTDCIEAICGNGIVESSEVCDTSNVSDSTCSSLGFSGGELACASDCSAFDTSSCSQCGNAICESGEDKLNCHEDCACPPELECTEYDSEGNMGCLDNGNIPAGTQTGCDITACTSGFSCICLDPECTGSGAICIEDC